MTLPTPNEQLRDPSLDDAKQFGRSVAVSDDVAMVGSPSPGGFDFGAVMFYKLDRESASWTYLETIPFGWYQMDGGGAVAKYGTDIIVGSPGVTSGAECCVQIGTYDPGDGATPYPGLRLNYQHIQFGGESLGFSVDIRGDLAAAGSPTYNGDDGVVWIYERALGSWYAASDVLLASPSGDMFGYQVCVSDDKVFASALQYNGVGSVSVIEYSMAWAIAQSIDSPADGVTFGWRLACSGDGEWLAVADPLGGATNDGRVMIYRNVGGTYTLNQTINSPSNGIEFGFSLRFSESGNTLYIGAPSSGTNGTVYMYTKLPPLTQFALLSTFTEADFKKFSYWVGDVTSYNVVRDFGWCIDCDEDIVICGAPTTDGSGLTDNGTAFTWINGATLSTHTNDSVGCKDYFTVDGVAHFIRQRDGAVVRDTPGEYLDPGVSDTYIPMAIQSAHLHMHGLQGFQRIRRVGVIGDCKDSHDFTIELFRDFETTPFQTESWTDAEIAALAAYPIEDLRIRCAKQRCRSVSVKISDSEPSVGTVSTGEGYSVDGITLQVGLRVGLDGAESGGRK